MGLGMFLFFFYIFYGKCDGEDYWKGMILSHPFQNCSLMDIHSWVPGMK